MTIKAEKQTRYLSQAVQLEEAVSPSIVRTTMAMVSLTIIVFLGWSALTTINEMAHTPGEVIPMGHQQVVQHLEGGIVRQIDIKEGQMVDKGQILLILDGAGSQDDLNRAASRQTSLALQEERLRAFIDNRNPDFSKISKANSSLVNDQKQFFSSMQQSRDEERKIIVEQITQKRRALQTLQSELATAQESLSIIEDLYERRRSLNEKGYASDVQFLETKQRYNDILGNTKQFSNRISVTRSEISEYENRLQSLKAHEEDAAHEQLEQVIAQASENNELIEKLRGQVGRLEIRAPANGMVKGLSINTIGEIVQPGQTLMEIVPMDKQLVVEVKIAPQHIGHLKEGQPVQVKFSSFDFSRYGFIPGKLGQISATTFTGQGGERYYQGIVYLDKSYVGDNPHNTIMPGMTVMADIITGQKTILGYLLKPIQVAMTTSFTER